VDFVDLGQHVLAKLPDVYRLGNLGLQGGVHDRAIKLFCRCGIKLIRDNAGTMAGVKLPVLWN
jgi:hypothetical protein